jgi:hypothetical protein
MEQRVPNNHKRIPNSIGIFGASGHIGGPMAAWLRYHAPHVRVRLITSNDAKAKALPSQYPGCEAVVGDYFDPASLVRAVADMEGLFVIATTWTPEELAMTNLVAAIRDAGCLTHMIRVVGEIPAANLRRVPPELYDFGTGIELQHPIARRILDESDLPNTYFNIGASFMDNLLRPGLFHATERKILWLEHQVPWIDPREIGEAAARVLLDDDHRHLYQFHTLNNGSDNLFFRDIAALMSEVLQTRIDYDPSEDNFIAALRKGIKAGIVPTRLPDYLRHYHRYEEENQVAWALNDFLERTLGRKPTTMRAWLSEHRPIFLERLNAARA